LSGILRGLAVSYSWYWPVFCDISCILAGIATKLMSKKTVGIAFSGGVDSTMAASLLLEEGWPVVGFFMELAQPNLDNDRMCARRIAAQLGIELRSIDLRADFQKRVLDYLRQEYRRGLTPNPCFICNREIKFGLLRQAMEEAGITLMATGHYANISQKNGLRLFRGADQKKDQSYFLAGLARQQLDGLMLPLGNYEKQDVIAMAKARGFAEFPGESQDACFLTDITVGDFLAQEGGEERGKPAGRILTTAGEEIGRHRGLFRYTVGQRRGLNLPVALPDQAPWYVVGLDARQGTVIVGKNEELLKKTLTAGPVRWLNPPSDFTGFFTVRIRAGHAGAAASLFPNAGGGLSIHFVERQRAIAPGQFAVIYQDDEVLGAAVIAASGE
jgi:tRNA-specific 2-thiouridylase